MREEHVCPTCGRDMWIAFVIQDDPIWFCDDCDYDGDDE